MYNGTASQVQAFKNQTGVTYPLGLNASSATGLYGVIRDYSAVVDQGGILRYKGAGVNTNDIKPLIENLLAVTGINDDNQTVDNFVLAQNYPNPFNPATNIKFSIPSAQHVTIKIYNSLGQHVRTLLDNRMNAGAHEISWNGLDQSGKAAASGIFYYVMEADNFKEIKKMMLMR